MGKTSLQQLCKEVTSSQIHLGSPVEVVAFSVSELAFKYVAYFHNFIEDECKA